MRWKLAKCKGNNDSYLHVNHLTLASVGPSCCAIVDGNARKFVPVQCVTDVSIENT